TAYPGDGVVPRGLIGQFVKKQSSKRIVTGHEGGVGPGAHRHTAIGHLLSPATVNTLSSEPPHQWLDSEASRLSCASAGVQTAAPLPEALPDDRRTRHARELPAL